VECFGPPEIRVNITKQRRISIAALEYLSLMDILPLETRFDVIAIVWPKGKSPQITHLEAAFTADAD
jgi:Holliday junction resolvase-like predicted endonuclease